MSCCEGHYPIYDTNIYFWSDYFKDKDIPKGFKKEVFHDRALINKITRDKNEDEKIETLKILKAWVDNLD